MERLDSDAGNLRRVAVAALVVSILVGLTSNLLFLGAFQFRLDWFLHPAELVAAGPTSAELLRWASLLDLLGYYIATAVLAYALWRRLRSRDATLADLSTLSALGYALIGGVGAATLALLGPMLMHQHADGSANPALVEAQFDALFLVVWNATWQLFDALLLGAWWIGLAILLHDVHRGLARLSLLLGTAALLGAAFTALGLDLARDIGLGVVFALWTAWWIWLLVAAGPIFEGEPTV